MNTVTDNISRTEHLLALMKKGDDAFNSRDFAAMRKVFHPDMIAHILGSKKPIKGQPAHDAMMKAMFSTFPDIQVSNDPYSIQFGNGEWTTVIAHTKGTFTGEMVLPDGKKIPPTGKTYDLDLCTIAKWDGDLLIEEYVFWDTALQAQQLGLA